jgi:hypothetical protein
MRSSHEPGAVMSQEHSSARSTHQPCRAGIVGASSSVDPSCLSSRAPSCLSSRAPSCLSSRAPSCLSSRAGRAGIVDALGNRLGHGLYPAASLFNHRPVIDDCLHPYAPYLTPASLRPYTPPLQPQAPARPRLSLARCISMGAPMHPRPAPEAAATGAPLRGGYRLVRLYRLARLCRLARLYLPRSR